MTTPTSDAEAVYALVWSDSQGPHEHPSFTLQGDQPIQGVAIAAASPKKTLDHALREPPGHVMARRFDTDVLAQDWWARESSLHGGDGCLVPARRSPAETQAAFVVVAVEIHDIDAFSKYAEPLDDVITSFGGTLLGSTPFPTALGESNVPHAAALMAWDNKEMAEQFYESAHYRPHRERRRACSDSLIVIVDRAQPPAPQISDSQHR